MNLYEKKYKEALNWMKDVYPTLEGAAKEDAEHYFPELKENEDERIRKDIISCLKYSGIEPDRPINPHVTTIKRDAIAWLEKQGKNNMGISEATKQKLEDNLNKALEKETPESCNEFLEGQGEQKPADKVEHKFKVGDWITNGIDVYKIKNIDLNEINYTFENGSLSDIILIDNTCHLWTIDDAKDGDVLVWDDSRCIALFKNVYDEDNFNSYGFIGHCTGKFEVRPNYHSIEGAHPATKEQRDTLMKAMADAGYTFDFEKKELKKIERETAWSEEDDRTLAGIIEEIEANKSTAPDYDIPVYDRFLSFLKSIKERVQPQPKQEWSEEDERLFQIVIDILDRENHLGNISHTDLIACVRKLKSLRPKNRWKPSEEQIEALDFAADCIVPDEFCFKRKELKGLLEQLKKLKD